MLKKLFLSFFVIQFAPKGWIPIISALSAQNKTIDSLLTLLKKDKPDTGKVIHLNNLCWEYQNISSYDTAFRYGNIALQLAEQLNFQKEIATAYNNIGNIYYSQGNYDKALENCLAALKIRENTGDKKGIADSYNNNGNIYYSQGNYDKALQNYLASLKMRKEIGNKNGIAMSYNNIGLIYANQGNYDKALENHLASLKIRNETDDKQGIAYSYDNIGEIYKLKGKPDMALENYFASLKICEEIGYKHGIAISYISIATIYMNKLDYSKATAWLQKGLLLAKEIGAMQVLQEAYKGLSEVNAKMNDYHSAYKYYQLYSQIKDSIFNQKSSKLIAEMQTKYETEKKEKEIQLLGKEKGLQQLEISQQKMQLYQSRISQTLLAATIFFIIIVSLLLYYNIQSKNRERIKTTLLAEQQERTKAVLEAQEKERTRIARDLHDGIAQTLAGVIMNMEQLMADDSGISPEKFRDKPEPGQAKNPDVSGFHRSEKKTLVYIRGMLQDAHKEVRMLSHQMIPRTLREGEFSSVLSELLDTTFSPAAIKYTFETVGPVNEINHEIKIAIYRIVQELSGNSIKHAEASKVSVQLIRNQKELLLLVEDNGKGLNDKEDNTKRTGIGIINIAARVQLLEGVFSIDNGPIQGVVAQIRIPI